AHAPNWHLALIRFANPVLFWHKTFLAMRNNQLVSVMLAALCGVLFSGCKKEASTPSTPPRLLSAEGTVARIHWLGKKQIMVETNSAGLMRIWNQPDSARIESEALDKISTAPWRLVQQQLPANNASDSLRPLLDDMVQAECYMEVRRPDRQSAEWVFAIRLDNRRADLWESNLAAVFE